MQAGIIAEINVQAVRGNLRAIRSRAGNGMPVCAAVKADAYGHGLDVILPVLAEAGVEQLAVANLHEAINLRDMGWHRPILCLGAPLAAANDAELRERCRLAAAAHIEVTISNLREAGMLAQEAARLHTLARVQIKVDSGMGRMGILCSGAKDVVDSLPCIEQISRCRGLAIAGVYTHFATADEADATFARTQLSRFLGLRDQLRETGVKVGAFHAANSAAIFRIPDACRGLDFVRPGICLYGYWDGPASDRPPELKPAMRVMGRIAAVRQVPADSKVGYGCTFTTLRPSTLGVVPIGYADGYRRLLSNIGQMTLPAAHSRPRRIVPVVGRVSMDQTIVDLTDAGEVRVGDEIVVIDNDTAAENSVESIARKLDTITYEITCLIGRRVRRIAVERQS